MSMDNSNKLDKIIDCLSNVDLDAETRDKALNNLVVLARDQGGAALYARPECLSTIKRYTSPKAPSSSRVSAFRLLSEICKAHEERTKTLIRGDFPIQLLVDMVEEAHDDEILTSFQYLIQTILNSLSFGEHSGPRAKPIDESRTKSVAESLASLQKASRIDKEAVKRNEDLLLDILTHLVERSSSVLLSAAARDRIIALIMSNLDVTQGLHLGQQLVDRGALKHLLNIACEVDELKHESSMPTSVSTHSLVSATLEKIYMCHDHDSSREAFRLQVQEFVDSKLKTPEIDDKVRVTKLFSTLLAGPTEIGNSCIGQNGMIEMILAMANSDELGPQKAALDTIIAASSKKDKCQALAKMGEKILTRLRDSNNDEIKFRALVGLAKISSVSGSDASTRLFDRRANIELARECRRVLARPTPEFNLKKWCAEAMAYLSFDGDVKQELIDDVPALQSLYELAIYFAGANESASADQAGGHAAVVFAALATMVNLTNAYDKQEKTPELLELAKFAQQHIPEEHPMDARPALESRLEALVRASAVAALVRLANELATSSKATQQARELMARILNALCELDKLRGTVIQQGGGSLLIQLAHDATTSKVPVTSAGDKQSLMGNTYTGALHASQALARLTITINPELAFPGQKLLAAVKPIRRLLDTRCTALQNFEGLMALTNLAQVSDAQVQDAIVRDQGYHQIEAYTYEEHELLRRAAVQCVANLIRHEQVVQLYELDESDRVKYLVILCQDDDKDTVSAAAGALAMLCQISNKACAKVFTAKHWCDSLMGLLSASSMPTDEDTPPISPQEALGLVHRALVIVHSIVATRQVELVARVFETQLFEVLMALSMGDERTAPEHIKSLAGECLDIGRELKLIKAPAAS